MTHEQRIVLFIFGFLSGASVVAGFWIWRLAKTDPPAKVVSVGIWFIALFIALFALLARVK